MVSVLLPVYNGEKYLYKCVKSILNQSFKDFELIIINDGSIDKSREIITSFRDERIRLVSNETNMGLIFSLNKGLKLIRSKYMVRMDADDISHSDRILHLVEFMESNPTVGICGTKVGTLEDSSSRPDAVLDADIRGKHLLNCAITHASAIYRMDIIRSNKLSYDEGYKHSEDNDFITNILKVSEGAILNQNLYWVRTHDDQVSRKFRDIQKFSSTKRRVELLGEVFGVNLNSEEIKLYQALSYKEFGLNSTELFRLGKLTLKLEQEISPNDDFLFNRKVFLKTLYRRLDIVYLKHGPLGISVFVNRGISSLF